jgi:DNA-binding NtrC family response regulator
MVTRIGAEKSSPTDFRLVAATHSDIDELRRSGQLRDDFFFRLNVVSLTVPPLRARRSDIPLLISHFVGLHAVRHRKQPIEFSPEALEVLQGYNYPGNVRELENLVERLQVMQPGEEIQPRHLPESVRQAVQPNGKRRGCFRTELPLREAVKDFEMHFIQQILEEENGNRTKAAKRLGIARKTLWEKLTESVTESSDFAETRQPAVAATEPGSRSPRFDGVAKSPGYGVTAFSQDLDIADVCLRP